MLDNRFENALDELQKNPISEEESTSGPRKEINAAVTAAQVELTEGRLDIARRQKRIKMADRSEFGWTTVKLYEHDELVSDSADEMKFDKAEKEAEKRVVKRRREKLSKRSKKSETNSPERKRSWSGDQQQHSSRRTMPVRTGGMCPIGPCYKCGEMGHLVATCQQVRPNNWYPFGGNTVKGIEEFMGYEKALEGGVDEIEFNSDSLHYEVIDSVTRYQEEPVNGPETIILGKAQNWEDHKEGEISGTGSTVEQITKVKGQLQQSLEFWREKLQASPFVMSCIEEGYKLPLLYEPPQYREENQGSAGVHEVLLPKQLKNCWHMNAWPK